MKLNNTDIQYIEDFLTKDQINYFDSVIQSNLAAIKEMAVGEGYKTLEVLDKHIIDQIAEAVKGVLPGSGELFPRYELQFTNKSHGMSPHFDGNGSDVAYGVVIYLSEPRDYVGGEIYYPNLDIEIKPAKGSMIVHPGTELYTHGVRSIEDGLRFVIVMFSSQDQA